MVRVLEIGQCTWCGGGSSFKYEWAEGGRPGDDAVDSKLVAILGRQVVVGCRFPGQRKTDREREREGAFSSAEVLIQATQKDIRHSLATSYDWQ